MGSGKSTLGKQLAALLGRTFTDLDRFIEIRENRTISEIFRQEGETAFRNIESKALAEVLAYPNQVIAIGGGAPCHKANMEMIRKKSLSVYLKISEPQLNFRLVHSITPRPLLKGKTESEIQALISGLLAARELFYCQADIIMESDAITAEMVLSELVAKTH